MKTVDCLFCGETAQRGKEHVFAEAMLNALDAGRETLLFERRSSSKDDLGQSRKHSYDSFQAGGICTACNQGWMSALEGSVVPWVLKVRAKEDLHDFQDAKRRLTFARWAVKTACVIDRVGGMDEIPSNISRQLFQMQDSVPENVRVVVGFHDWPAQTRFTFNQRNRWTYYPLYQVCEDPECSIDGMFFKVAFAIERLMVLVLGMASAHFHPVVGTGIHIPIWPEHHITNHHWFHSMRIDGCNAEEALRNFSDLFAAAHGGRMR